MEDYDKDGNYDSYDALIWNDKALDGKAFKNWSEFNHPQLGKVEIGGFNPKFFSQNPPTEYLEEWAKKQAMFNLMLAEHLPQIEINEVIVTQKNVDTYKINISFTNTGFLPTALEQAKLVKIVKQDRVRLEFNEELIKNERVEIIVPKTIDKDIELGWTKRGENKKAEFEVKLNGIKKVECVIHLLSTRGGHKTQKITIGK